MGSGHGVDKPHREHDPARKVDRESLSGGARMRALLGGYTREQLHEAAAYGRVNSALDLGSSMPRSQMTLAERLADPDD